MRYLRGLLASGALGLAGGVAMMGVWWLMGVTDARLTACLAAGSAACALAAWALG